MTPHQQHALDELKKKTLNDIQVETALTWAHRAWAAQYLVANGSLEGQNAVSMLHDAVEYEHEALEHAALSGDDKVLQAVRRIIGRK